MDPEEVETASIRSGSAVLSHQSVELLPDHDGEVATDVIHIEGDKEPDENQFPLKAFLWANSVPIKAGLILGRSGGLVNPLESLYKAVQDH